MQVIRATRCPEACLPAAKQFQCYVSDAQILANISIGSSVKLFTENTDAYTVMFKSLGTHVSGPQLQSRTL